MCNSILLAYIMPIKSFQSANTERLFKRNRVKQWQAIERAAQRKLAMIHNARALGDLSAAPGNRLEKLRGQREGQYSIRINDQWRICFVWQDGNAYEVEITD